MKLYEAVISCSKLLYVLLSSNLLTWVGRRVDEMQNKANAQPALATAGSWGLAELGHTQL